MQTGASVNLDGIARLRVIAAFDIGSNSIKMTVARQTPSGDVEEFLWRAETTRLGAGIERTGRLAEDRIDASLAALAAFVAEAKRFGATRFLGVATEAARVAENGPVFLDQVRAKFGIELESISGEREAELTFLGLDPRLDRSGTVIVADIGGASTEVIDARNGQVHQSRSFPIGSGRYTDRYIPSDPPRSEELALARDVARKALGTLPWTAPVDRLVITGGTAGYVQVLLGHEWPATTMEIEAMLERLTLIPSRELAPMIAASELRARVLPAGVAIALALTDLTAPAELLGAASGIRLGLLMAAFRENA
jgi:exopolyphosphatase/guanosine-5'-triphosphate,3'-diphosphate pyrophosphatase